MIKIGDRVKVLRSGRRGVVTIRFTHASLSNTIKVVYDEPYIDPVQGLIKSTICKDSLVEKMETGT
jgi:hypothetical protein